MDKFRITRNIRRIEVNDEGECITLDFDDLNLPYRYYDMVKSFEAKRKAFYEQFSEQLKADDGNTNDALVEAERKLYSDLRDGIDTVFGKDTCRKVFGDILPSLEMYMQFFDALTPYFEEEAQRRRAKMGRYSARRNADVR